MKELFASYLFAKGIPVRYDIFFVSSRHVECCVLLYHKDYKVREKGKKVTVDVGMNK